MLDNEIFLFSYDFHVITYNDEGIVTVTIINEGENEI